MDDITNDEQLENCSQCGHPMYHHRPKCGFREKGLLSEGGTRCGCTKYVHEEYARLSVPLEPVEDVNWLNGN